MSIAMLGTGLRKVAAVGALALASAGLSIATTSPAQAESASLSYTCTVPILGDKTFTVVADTDAPAKTVVGQSFTPAVASTVTIPEDVAGLISGVLGATTVEGTAVVTTLVGDRTEAVDLAVPLTEIPAGPLAVVATGVGAPVTATKAGQLVLASSDFTSHLVFKKADGSEALTADVPCTLDEGQDATVDTIAVAKAGTRTSASVKYVKSKKQFKLTAKVKAPVKATGTVKLAVTKNGKKFKTVKAKVNKRGVAKATVKRVKKGKYVIKATYSGNKNLKASTDKVKKKV
ncbi:hypothetical protein ncot_12825 [Nocardioides sp. JQ2195]|uniref:DUF6801 domain-containing protein n=1 Tax=Nocardioides sp. JQ2195 TaxID=2592334 RepID=UPI00143E5005|nr:DUF6801 domain-containing protein [Nocardioides sp. JQ2195]QIX27386.1 hypothetical protein ncot_12825 [Nocardioides sp. JQ2195]